MKEYARGVLHGVLIFLVIFTPAYLIGQQSMTGRNYTNTWAVPSGTVFLIVSGTCPAGSTEVTSLDGAMPYGTLAAHGDVGGTGGANTVTPTVATLTAAAQTFTGSSGTVPAQTVSWPVNVPTNASGAFSEGAISWPVGVPAIAAGVFTQPTISWPVGVPTFSGSAGTVPAQTFTGTPFSSVINHTHTITVTSLVQGGTTAATTGTHVMTSTAVGGSARAITSGDSITATSANPSGGVSSITPAGTNSTAAFTPVGTVAWPVGVPTNASGAFAEGAISWPGGVPTIAAGNFTQPTISWPMNPPTNGTSAFIPAGTNGTSAVTGTLNSVDNRSAFVKVIYCQRS